MRGGGAWAGETRAEAAVTGMAAEQVGLGLRPQAGSPVHPCGCAAVAANEGWMRGVFPSSSGQGEVWPLLVLPPPWEVTPHSGASVSLVGKMGHWSSWSLRVVEGIKDADPWWGLSGKGCIPPMITLSPPWHSLN